MITLSCFAVAVVTATAPTAYEREVQAWRAHRLERLRAEDGWLTLAGLFWLAPGDNLVGSAKDCVVHLPKGPRRLGVVKVTAGQVRFVASPGMTVTHQGRAVSNIALQSDAKGDPTVLATDSLRFFVIERGGKPAVRLRDIDSPVRRNFAGIDAFPIDPAWRIQARYVPYAPPKHIDVPTVLGTVEPSVVPGALVFEVAGRTYRLDALAEEGDDELFIIFADATNGKETYGPGRFIYTERPKDGRVVLDFNKAFNPPCAFTPYATCPLPPPQNRLPLSVTAGEKRYGHH